MAETEAERDARMRREIRSMAVALVDSQYGYTAEFSANPERHRQEYHEMEDAILTKYESMLASGTLR